MAIAWTSTSAEVAIETLERLLIQTANQHPFSVCPIRKVFRRPDVSAGRDLCIARLGQLLREPFKKRPDWASTKFMNPHK